MGIETGHPSRKEAKALKRDGYDIIRIPLPDFKMITSKTKGEEVNRMAGVVENAVSIARLNVSQPDTLQISHPLRGWISTQDEELHSKIREEMYGHINLVRATDATRSIDRMLLFTHYNKLGALWLIDLVTTRSESKGDGPKVFDYATHVYEYLQKKGNSSDQPHFLIRGVRAR